MSLRLSFLASTVERIMTGCHVRRYVVLAVVSSVRKGAHNPMLHKTGMCSGMQWDALIGTQGYAGRFAVGLGRCLCLVTGQFFRITQLFSFVFFCLLL